MGVAPLLYFGKRIKAMGGEPTFLLGARSAKDVLERELFEQVGRVFITTEDGSEGEKGFVTNHSAGGWSTCRRYRLGNGRYSDRISGVGSTDTSDKDNNAAHCLLYFSE